MVKSKGYEENTYGLSDLVAYSHRNYSIQTVSIFFINKTQVYDKISKYEYGYENESLGEYSFLWEMLHIQSRVQIKLLWDDC